jgi:prolyl-tRNA editing enzyme YbaK/EbsC (Cys-tRNA(Pro) deacylase)
MSSASAVLTSPSVERVRHALERAGMQAEIVELPGAARTAKAAAEFLGCELGQIANSLVFRARTSSIPVLVMSSGARRVDTDRLSALLGEPIDKADAGFVRTHTGFAIGGVAPAGHSLEKIFIEKQLSRYAELWAAAGHPHTVFRLTYAQLLQITRGTTAELAA